MEAKKNEEYFRELFQGAGPEQAPEGFERRVMDRIEALQDPVQVQQTLISSKAWAWIIAWTSGLVFAGVFWTRGGESGYLLWDTALGKVRGILGDGPMLPELPDSFAYCGLALLFFMLLHFIWMRRYLERRLAF